MGTTRRRAPIRRDRDRAGAVCNSRIRDLERSFARFRGEHPPRTRISHALRNAALAALRGGTPALDVRRACGVTSDQLAQWQKGQENAAESCDLAEQKTRVFPVIDDVAGVVMTDDGGFVQQALELRMGGWALSIRQIEA